MPTRILIADDNALVRRALRVLIETNEDWKVCAEAVNGREAVAKAFELRPDLIVMDFLIADAQWNSGGTTDRQGSTHPADAALHHVLDFPACRGGAGSRIRGCDLQGFEWGADGRHSGTAPA